MLFRSYSSTFNTVVLSKVVTKILSLGVSQWTCRWIKDFLTNRLQSIKPVMFPCRHVHRQLPTWLKPSCSYYTVFILFQRWIVQMQVVTDYTSALVECWSENIWMYVDIHAELHVYHLIPKFTLCGLSSTYECGKYNTGLDEGPSFTIPDT